MISTKEVNLFYQNSYNFLVKSMKMNKDFQDYEKKMREDGMNFSHEMYEEMKQKS